MPGRDQFMNRTTSRKAMRAAVVFTGAAAAGVAFGPGAALAAAGHTPAQGHSARAAGTTPANIQLTAADIKSNNCTTNTWLHIAYFSNEIIPLRTLCKQFGFSGVKDVVADGMYMVGQCGGNNYGTVYYSGKSIPYGPGTTYRTLKGWVSDVSIYYWSGNDKCAWPE
jgi:hypothetical protein